MCNAFECYLYLVVCCTYFIGSGAEEYQLPQFKHCSTLGVCPDNSICTKVHADLKCVCWHGYHQNSDWSEGVFDSADSDYCTREVANKTVILHNRLPPSRENLAIAILLVLFGVIIVTLVFYCIGVVRPINRTRAVYRRLQLRRNNHRRLEEFDDIDMTFRNTRNNEEFT